MRTGEKLHIHEVRKTREHQINHVTLVSSAVEDK